MEREGGLQVGKTNDDDDDDDGGGGGGGVDGGGEGRMIWRHARRDEVVIISIVI